MAFKSRKWLGFANAERQEVPDPWFWRTHCTSESGVTEMHFVN